MAGKSYLIGLTEVHDFSPQRNQEICSKGGGTYAHLKNVLFTVELLFVSFRGLSGPIRFEYDDYQLREYHQKN